MNKIIYNVQTGEITTEEIEEFEIPDTEVIAPLSEIEQLRLETAQSNAELFEMMLMMMGGV